METLLNILQELRPDIDYKRETDLVMDGILTSLDILQIVAEICDVFDVEIPPREVRAANFKSADAILAMIERIKNEN